MTNDSTEEGHNAEVVPVHPELEQLLTELEQRAPGAPEVLPAVRAEPGQELEPARQVPVYQDITRVPGERLPVIPPQWHGRANIRASLLLVGGQHWHRARYHGVRSPLYLLSAIWWAIVGIFRVVARQIHWWWLLEQHDLRSLAVVEGDSREWTKLHKEAKETRKVRGLILAAEIVGLAVAILILIHLHIWWTWLALTAVIVPLLARYGRPADLRIIRTAIIPPDYQPPTHEIITGALGSLGIPNINAALRVDKDGHSAGIRFISEVMRDGPGWGCQLDLPGGVTATHILAKREELASGMRRPLSATWPAGVPHEHPGRLDLWIGFQDISKMRAPKWPLLKAASTDVFDRLPFGTDPRSRGVTVPLFEVNWLIGAAPGQGKTSAVRGLACGVALDVLADLWIHEQAGKGDLEPLAQVCHRYCSGLDDEAIAYAAESLRMLRTELDRRSASLKSVDKLERPEGKVTRELAARKALKLRPLVAIFDEIQNVFLHPIYGKQAAEDAAHVIRLGRAYGVILVLSTQRPTTECLPASVSGNVTARFCLQVPGQIENDLVLGTSSYKDGYKATAFRPKTDAGLGWLKADGLPQIVRTYKVDLPECEKIAARARVMRDRAGVLTGYALTEGEAIEARDVLADVLAVFGDAPGLHWAELADRLANRWPDRWADVTAESISAQCRSLGIQSVDVKMAGVTLKGCRRVALDRARQA